MSTRSALELKIRITLLLLLWAAICLTTYSERSTLLNSKLKEKTSSAIIELPDYLLDWDKLNN